MQSQLQDAVLQVELTVQPAMEHNSMFFKYDLAKLPNAMALLVSAVRSCYMCSPSTGHSPPLFS